MCLPPYEAMSEQLRYYYKHKEEVNEKRRKKYQEDKIKKVAELEEKLKSKEQ